MRMILTLVALAVMTGGVSQAQQSNNVNLLSQNRDAWSDKILFSTNPHYSAEQWRLSKSASGITFESTSEATAMISVRRPDLSGCKSIRATLVLDGNYPAAAVVGDPGFETLATSGGTFTRDIPVRLLYDGSLAFAFILSGRGKFWGSITNIVALGCNR
jgi:hypothetical protein